MRAFVILFLSISALLVLNCTKDKSCVRCSESPNPVDTIPVPTKPVDTIPPPSTFSEGEWSFTEGSKKFSGKVDTAFIIRESNWESITFGGFTNTSNGVIDTTYRATVLFHNFFTKDTTNISTVDAAFYFQAQGNGSAQWLYEHHPSSKSLTHKVDSYNAKQREYKGQFFGYVTNMLTSDTCYISSGRFRLKF